MQELRLLYRKKLERAANDRHHCRNLDCIHLVLLSVNTSSCPAGAYKWLRSSSSLNNLDQHDDDGDHQQDMNDPTHRVASHQSQSPQNQKNHKYGPKHVRFLSRVPRLNVPLLVTNPLVNSPTRWSCSENLEGTSLNGIETLSRRFPFAIPISISRILHPGTGGNREMMLTSHARFASPQRPYATPPNPAAAISPRARDEAAPRRPLPPPAAQHDS